MTVTARPSKLSPTRPRTRPIGPLGSRLVELAEAFHQDQYQLVVTAAAFADSGEWIADGATHPLERGWLRSPTSKRRLRESGFASAERWTTFRPSPTTSPKGTCPTPRSEPSPVSPTRKTKLNSPLSPDRFPLQPSGVRSPLGRTRPIPPPRSTTITTGTARCDGEPIPTGWSPSPSGFLLTWPQLS